jgi:hypothetical protein
VKFGEILKIDVPLIPILIIIAGIVILTKVFKGRKEQNHVNNWLRM